MFPQPPLEPGLRATAFSAALASRLVFLRPGGEVAKGLLDDRSDPIFLGLELPAELFPSLLLLKGVNIRGQGRGT